MSKSSNAPDIHKKKPLLVVDGYNVLFASERYQALIDKHPGRAPLFSDPFVRAREALTSDVAAYAGSQFEAVIVYDAANNKADEHPAFKTAGVTLLYSERGESADAVIEKLVTQARTVNRSVTLVTSDTTVRATAGFGPGEVTCISSRLLLQEIQETVPTNTHQAHTKREKDTLRRGYMRLADRLPADQKKKLEALLKRPTSAC